MSTMKRAVAIATILLLSALSAVAEPGPPPARHFSNRLLEDVVQMTRAGLSDATIVAYVKSRSSRFDGDVTADDLIRLQRAGVSETVVRFIASAAGVDNAPGRRDNDVTYDSRGSDRRGSDEGSVEPSDGEDVAVAVGPADGYGYPYWYGYYPYWYAYSPFFSGGVFFSGRGFFRGGRFGRRTWSGSGRSFSGSGRSFSGGGRSSGHGSSGHGHR
jgi:hypothetical protein